MTARQLSGTYVRNLVFGEGVRDCWWAIYLHRHRSNTVECSGYAFR